MQTIKKERVVVAMSGGVDSSVAALVLKNQGYEVIGCTMYLSDHRESSNAKFDSCCSPKDTNDARLVCEKLGIPHYVLNMETEFKEKVIGNFISEYMDGRTPIPCVHCNKEVKFNHLLRKAKALGALFLATGHYAKKIVDPETGECHIVRPKDLKKDQTYFLFNLKQDELKNLLFPLSDMDKSEVRELAREYKLGTAGKPDSYEICFVPNNNYSQFIEKNIPTEAVKPGAIVDTTGKKVGVHGGIFNFTVGQRKGLGLQTLDAHYVTKINVGKNEVVVGKKEEMLKIKFIANHVTWVAPTPDESISVEAKVRYQHTPERATVLRLDDSRYEVTFEHPVRAISPGQATVFYRGDELLGGGWIQSVVE